MSQRARPVGYSVEIAPAANRQLRKLPPGAAAVLRAPILALAIDPRPPNASKLEGSDFSRIRVGDLRVIYAIDDRKRVVIVLRPARRSESIYRQVR